MMKLLSLDKVSHKMYYVTVHHETIQYRID